MVQQYCKYNRGAEGVFSSFVISRVKLLSGICTKVRLVASGYTQVMLLRKQKKKYLRRDFLLLSVSTQGL